MKKLSILLLLMAMFAPLAMNGQTRSTLTVYDQNTTTNQYVPIYGYYCDSKSKCEFIIPKEAISDMNGGVISAMKFYLGSSNSNDAFTVTFDVFVKEVEATTLSDWTGQSNATTIYTGNITIPKSGSNVEFDIPFSSNYVYNGGNLLVGFYQTGNTSSYNRTYWTGETQTTNTAYGGYTSSGSAQKFLPKTTFTYEIITTPTINLPATATVLTGSTETLMATTLNVTGTPTITYSSNNPSVATVSGNGTTATVTGVSAGTATITATMTYNGNTYTGECAVTVEDPSYCEPGPSSIDGSGISNVTFGTNLVVNDNLSMTGSPYYYDHSNKIGDIEAGSTVEMSINYVTNYGYYTYVWIDLNKDYAFSNDEQVYAATSTISSGLLSLQFDVPSSVTPDDYRMRIQGRDRAGSDPCFTGTYSYLVDYTLRVIAASNCKKPTGLAATNVTKNSAILNWTENGEATSWNISVNGATTPNITKPYPLNNLTPDTDYTVKVSPVCEDEVWSDEYTFHTEVACPAPTALTSTVTPNSASLNWTSDASAFNVRYAKILDIVETHIFSDDFENGLDNWTTYTEGNAAAWRTTDPSSGLEWTGHNGSTNVAISMSWNNDSYTADNWLVTPQIPLNGTLKFYVYTNQRYPDDYEVKLSTTGNGIDDFTITLQEMASIPTTGDWVEVSIDLSDYQGQTGYIAIHHYFYDGNYILVDDFDITSTEFQLDTWEEKPAETNSLTISSGLESETDYLWQVQAVCGGTDGSSVWSESAEFHVPSACDAPIQLQADALHTTANVSWTGYQDEYTLQWRSAAHQETILEQGFENGLGSWQFISNNTANEMDASNGAGVDSDGAHTGAKGLWFSSWNSASDYNQYLISPEISSTGTLTFYYKNYSTYEETFCVGYSTNGNSISDFTWGSDITIGTGSWTLFTENMPSGAKYFAINYKTNYQYFLYIDDIVILGNEIPAGSWETRTVENASSYEITGLTANTPYEWQVEGICTSNITGYSQSTFTTLSNNQKVFMVAGNWDNASNWEGGIPTASDVAYIRKAATIPASYDAVASEITIQDGGSITIKDGGQLHSNSAVTATLEKEIAGYTPNTKDNYYLISSPISNISTANVENLLTGTFDFYAFDGTQDLEWRNHQQSPISTMGFGVGYLYANANQNGTTLKFTGEVRAQISNLYYINGGSGHTLNFNESMEFGTWNLVGNPFPHNAYVYVGTVSSGVTFATNQYYYKINENGRDEVIASNEIVKPGEGVFVQATASSQYAFASSVNQMSKARGLNMSVANSNRILDRAVMNFGEGEGLGKFQLNPNHTKVYIPQNGKDYAVVYTEEQGTMPVNFKAENNDTYTLSFTTEEVSFAYLHLIDNMTGNDVDLLANPSYSFNAKTTDYENRFKLVFATGNSTDDTFAFFSNGSFVINNEGEATLQVIDINGRIVKSESINGCANVNVNAAQGIYMLRLVNGDNVKVQKVVVR